MSTARYIVGDSLDVIRKIPDNSVDLIMTSPPFLALRSYLPADHPDKSKEIGSEATPAEFIDVLLDHTEEWARVLAPHGSIVVELGDTYSGSGGAGGDYNEGGLREGAPRFTGSAHLNNGGRHWPLAKCLALIPESYRWALAYGRNPFNGRTTEPWRVRNVVRWHRPNPPVGALGDKFRPSTSELVIACKAKDRYFDLDATREQGNPDAIGNKRSATSKSGALLNGGRGGALGTYTTEMAAAGAPPLDTWVIPTQPYKGSHYATYPTALCIKPILAMCPQRVCTTCGQPSRRIAETTQLDTGRTTNGAKPRDRAESSAGTTYEARTSALSTTLGWSDCGHDSWRNGVVLDPFAGSGTTLEVATGHDRDAIGIDLDARNAELAQLRVDPTPSLFRHFEIVVA